MTPTKGFGLHDAYGVGIRAHGPETAILFLDIDGVLNCHGSWERPRVGKHRIDRDKVALLTEVVASTGCKVVVSSTWRRDTRCRGILRYYGFRGSFHRDWRTDWQWSEDEPRRGHQIARWLARNGSPPFAIVDDDSDMLDEQRGRFVQTTFETGLTRDHADRLIATLLSSGRTLADAHSNQGQTP